MTHWQPIQLDNICEVTSSKRIYAKELRPSGVPFYRSKEIIEKLNGQKVHSNPLFISEERYQEIVRQAGALIEGDILLTSRGTLGIPYLVKATDRFHFADGNLTWFRRFKEADSMYLKYFLLSPIGKAELARCVIGSSQLAYTISALKKISVPLPPLPIQQRIASILAAYDDLIENNTRRINILEEMAQAVYREWFVNFRFPGREQVKMVDSPLGMVPDGWEVKPLEYLVEGHIGGGWGKEEPEENFTETAWVIRGTDIPGARHCQANETPCRYHTSSNLRSRRLSPGEIVFEVSGGSKGQPVGRSLFITRQLLSTFGGDSVICASFCKRVQPKPEIYGAEILYLSFVEGYTSGEIEQYQVQSTGISNYKWTEYLHQTQRVVPPRDLQVKFCDVVKPVFAQIASLGLKSSNLRQTRDLLLPKLIAGEVDVSKLEISVGAA